MNTLTIPEQLMLLMVTDDEGEYNPGSLQYAYIFEAASLAELFFRQKVFFDEKSISTDSEVMDLPEYLEIPLSFIRGMKKKENVRDIVMGIHAKKPLKYMILDSLISAGVLTKHRRKFLGIIPYSAYTTDKSALRQTILSEIRSTLDHQNTSIERIIGLIPFACSAPASHLIFGSERKSISKQFDKFNDEVLSKPEFSLLKELTMAVYEALSTDSDTATIILAAGA